VLQNQNTRPFRSGRIILDNFGETETVDDILREYIIGSQFVIAVRRYEDFAAWTSALILSRVSLIGMDGGDY
jgi:hypothetical protein